MMTVDDLIKEMRNNPKDVRFVDACKVADELFGEPRQKGTSHRVWKMPWAGDPRVNLQEGKGGKAKAYQVKQLLQAVDHLRAEETKRTAVQKSSGEVSKKEKKTRKT
jgi:hypothetical protein